MSSTARLAVLLYHKDDNDASNKFMKIKLMHVQTLSLFIK